jgi:mono/diheme cytochrome c family protein
VIGPTLPQIQAIVFGPKCASCHNGVGAALPGVMNLTSEAASLAALVNVPSIQDGGAFDRVEPGQPDMSYLVHKIDGTAASQMPPVGGPLPQAEIDAIRQWILDGALP